MTSYDFDATSVAFTPDGAAVISSSHDQSVKRVALATTVRSASIAFSRGASAMIF